MTLVTYRIHEASGGWSLVRPNQTSRSFPTARRALRTVRTALQSIFR